MIAVPTLDLLITTEPNFVYFLTAFLSFLLWLTCSTWSNSNSIDTLKKAIKTLNNYQQNKNESFQNDLVALNDEVDSLVERGNKEEGIIQSLLSNIDTKLENVGNFVRNKVVLKKDNKFA